MYFVYFYTNDVRLMMQGLSMENFASLNPFSRMIHAKYDKHIQRTLNLNMFGPWVCTKK